MSSTGSPRSSQRTKTDWDDILYHAIKKTRFIILLAAAVYAGSLYLDLSDTADARLRKAILVIGWIQVGIWVKRRFSRVARDLPRAAARHGQVRRSGRHRGRVRGVRRRLVDRAARRSR